MKPAHTNRYFDVELRELRSNLTAMGARCERALQLAVAAFLERDAEKAAEAAALDARIDRDQVEIDELALRILALRQPVAYDLRFLATTLKFVTDLERIGDKATSIAKRARDVSGAALLPPHEDILPLSQKVLALLRDAIDAFVEGDVDKAERVLAAGHEIDALAKPLTARIVAWMAEHPTDIPAALAVMSVARQLKRVADHATNLAEQAVFMVRGEDVRYQRGPAAP
ncbi:MAG: phosphate signaling complex protein PhoU [Myxococcaceae bacterium]|nr:MAG: phosphate signaling complex protein PhoU [Myxococcaceae bacterium]